MLKQIIPLATAVALLAGASAVGAQQTTNPAPMASGMSSMYGPDHGMPQGTMGGDGTDYTGAPDLQAAISLVTAGGAPGNFSITTALTSLVGAQAANAEVAKLTSQYGADAVASFVEVQNFAVNDAVDIAIKAGVKFPAPTLKGTELATRVVQLGLVNGTYYEGTQLDHLVTHAIHEKVMDHIDGRYGVVADANYHKIADQAHYDLAQALGAKNVGLAAFH